MNKAEDLCPVVQNLHVISLRRIKIQTYYMQRTLPFFVKICETFAVQQFFTIF